MNSRHFAFYLAPQFSLLSLLPLTETLRKANELAGAPLYTCSFLGVETSVAAVNGMAITAQTDLPAAKELSAAIFCASYVHQLEESGPLFNWMRRLARHGVALGTSDAGAFLVAQANINWGTPICMHWQSRPAFEKAHPDFPVSDRLFEYESTRFSCIGATSGFDLMLHILAEHQGRDFAAQLSSQLALDRREGPNASYRGSLADFLIRSSHPIIRRVLVAMDQSCDTKRSIPDLAAEVGLTQTQLNRLFKRQLGTTPVRVYQLSRLRRAQTIIRSSDLSIEAVAEDCGFASRSQFVSAYKARFGHAPSAARGQWNQKEVARQKR